MAVVAEMAANPTPYRVEVIGVGGARILDCGVLETRKLPTEEVVTHLCQQLGLDPTLVALLCAPASSMAGTLQVVARSVETALHKLHELHFDLVQVVSAQGWAPLPPVASDEI